MEIENFLHAGNGSCRITARGLAGAGTGGRLPDVSVFRRHDDPAINISRVKSRVKLGGHNVPEDKMPNAIAFTIDIGTYGDRLWA